MKSDMKKVDQIDRLFSKRLDEKMQSNRVNQMELARMTGIQQNKISRILRGRTRIVLQDYVILMMRLDPEFRKEMHTLYGDELYILCQPWQWPVFSIHAGHAGIDLAFGTVYVSAPSKPLCPPLSLHEGVSWLHSVNSSKDAGMFANVCCVDGVWATVAIPEYHTTVQRDFQCQQQLGQAARA